MLIVLPPSETKAWGGNGTPLKLESLSFPELNDIRADIAADLQALDTTIALEVLGISEKLANEAEANRELLGSPTTPAILRYTGVLYDALDAASLPSLATPRLAIGSALFGVVGAGDLIPHYRLSGQTKLPRRAGGTHSGGAVPTMKARWGKAITNALSDAEVGLIVDLRSGTYQQLGKVADAVTVRVETEYPDGTRKVVSHFNKHYKGELARVLATADAEPGTRDEVIDVAKEAGMNAEPSGKAANEITLVIPA